MRKIIAMLLCICMIMSMTIMGCSAVGSEEWKNNTGEINLTKMTSTGSGVSISDNTVSITEGGDFTVTGTLENGMIYVNTTDRVKLRLSNASITNSTGPAIFFDNVDKGFITITKDTENYLADGTEYTTEGADAALFSNDDLEIKGSGTLTVTGNFKHGIASDDDISIEEGIINITAYEHGIKANNTLRISGGTLTVKANTGKGMKAGEELIIDDGYIDIESLQNEGIESKGTLVINDGEIHIVSADDGINTGNESTAGDTADGMRIPRENIGEPSGESERMRGGPQTDGRIPPDDSDMIPPEMPYREKDEMKGRPFGGEMDGNMPQINDSGSNGREEFRGKGGGGFGFVDEETAAAHSITINGGKLYINASCDGIDSNGNLTINGGEIIIDGPVGTGNDSIDSDGTFVITGGILIAGSSGGMTQMPQGTDNQNTVRISFETNQSAGCEITVTETDSGNVIMSYTPAKEYRCVLFSSPELKSGKEYTIHINGTEFETFTASEGVNSVGNATGIFGGRGGFGKGEMMNYGKNGVRVILNGSPVRFETSPVIKNDTTLVGFRAILEALGATVDWDENTQTVTAEKDGTTIKMQIGSCTAYVNGEQMTLLTAPEIIGNSTMVPVRFISEQMNMNVLWDEQTNTVSIDSVK